MLTALLIVTCAAADAPYSARLLAQADLPAATVNRADLAAERARLIADKPGLGFPIAMMSIGGSGALLFTGTFVSLASEPYYGIGVGPAIALSVLIAGSVAVAVIGVVALIGRLSKRTETEARLKVIEQQIGPSRPGDELVPPGPPPPPPGPDLGPPGPPPPPPPPLAMVTLGSF